MSDAAWYTIGMLATWYTMSGAVTVGAFVLRVIP